MNLKDPARVLDEISHEQLPPDLDLMPGIQTKIQSGNNAAMKPTTRWRFAALLLVLVLLVAFFRLPDVTSAVRSLIGYIPGVGTVEQSASLRILASPVSEMRDGFTLTIQSAVLDPSRTLLTYRLSGPFPTWDDPALKPRMCAEPPILRLAGGRELASHSQEGSSGGGESAWQAAFSAIPPDDDRATLILPCLSELPAGEGPQDWEVPLAFVPAPPEMTVYPVVELPTPPPAATILQPSKTEGPAPTDGMQFTLQGIAVLDEGHYLQTLLSWDEDPAFFQVQVFPDAVHLFDAAGQEVPIWPADLNPPGIPAESRSLPLNWQTAPLLTPGPANLVLDYVGLGMAASASFTLELGKSPQPGQTWPVNQDLEVNGYPLRVVSAEYIQAAPGEPAMLMLYLDSDAGILMVTAMDHDHEIQGTGGSPGSDQVPFRAGWYYKDGFPQGAITVDITAITVRRDGPWSISWTPPDAPPEAATPSAPAGQAAAPEPGVCPGDPPAPISSEDLPEELSGRVAFSEGQDHDLFVANLDGSGRIPLGTGVFPDLSPDGRQVAYRGLEGGLYVRELDGVESVLISGPPQESISDLRPRWSPDARHIVFDRVIDHAADIYRVDPDGSNLQAILNSPADESFLGWASDGRQVIYQVTTPEGQSIRRLDPETGRQEELALLPFSVLQIKLAPDGARLASVDDRGVSLVSLDGSAPVLLLANPSEFANPIWSPDSRWISLSYWPTEDNSPHDLALLQPDTCRLLLLEANLGNWISSWIP